MARNDSKDIDVGWIFISNMPDLIIYSSLVWQLSRDLQFRIVSGLSKVHPFDQRMIPWQCLSFISQHSMLAGWAQGKEANFLLPMCVATLDLVVAASAAAMPAMAAEAAAAANQQLTSRVRPHKKVPAPLFFFLFSFSFFSCQQF